jgi:hypothetical protein
MLKIEKIANLNHQEMRETKGMTALGVCSLSCSALAICCDTKTIPLVENKMPAKGQ